MRTIASEIQPRRPVLSSIIIIFTVVCLSPLVLSFSSARAQAKEKKLSTRAGYVSTSHDITSQMTGEDRELRPGSSVKRANFKKVGRSSAAQKFADWIVDSEDNSGMPFVLVDKVDARVFVFASDGQLRGSAPALLGLARGDDSVPGIGDRPLSAIRPEQRTTPAGRFVGLLGHNADGSNVLWIDHEKAVSLHRVITDDPRERRLQRLASPTPLDNRISYGCINVPVNFFDDVVRPVLANTRGVIYVLPETRSNREIFESYYEVE
ncbi:MAG: hypothetical protein PHT96_05350 [Syntrophorhabdaceae bacterium]|nr:hypothetical protein [Syntrophorhabdaceae bacterium]